MKNNLLILLLIVAFVMIFLGFYKVILPPILTGVGFIIIALLFKKNLTDYNFISVLYIS